MDEREARAVLGLDATATRTEARAAYRRLVRTHHPDVAGSTGAPTTARILDAWRVLRELDDAPVVTDNALDTITLSVPADEAFLLLLDAAYRVGDVTHVAPDDGLLETLLSFDDGRIASLVISLQGRGDGTTEAFCTLQALDAGANPPVGVAVAALIAELAEIG